MHALLHNPLPFRACFSTPASQAGVLKHAPPDAFSCLRKTRANQFPLPPVSTDAMSRLASSSSGLSFSAWA